MCQIKGRILGIVGNMETQGNAPRSNFIDLLHVLMGNIYHYYQELAIAAARSIRKVCDYLPIAELSDAIGDKLAEYPVLSFILLSMVLSCAFPIIVFIIFAVTSIILTFAGFIFIEGTILTFGCICLFGCLLLIILAMSMIAASVFTLYFVLLKMAKFMMNCDYLRNWAKNILQFLTQNEENFDVVSDDAQDN